METIGVIGTIYGYIGFTRVTALGIIGVYIGVL